MSDPPETVPTPEQGASEGTGQIQVVRGGCIGTLGSGEIHATVWVSDLLPTDRLRPPRSAPAIGASPGPGAGHALA
jgi:hypothetical protein